MPRRSLLIASFAVVCVVWGSTYLGIRIALESFPPFLLGAVRFIAAGGILLVFARARGVALPTAREWGSSLLTGTLFFLVGNGLVNVAERSVSSGLASVLVATMPLWATVFGRLFGTPASRREIAGVSLGLAGVVVLNLGGDLQGSSVAGIACALVAPLGWALGSLGTGRLPHPKDITMKTGAQMLGGGVSTLLASIVLHEPMGHPTARTWAAAAYLLVFGSLLGFMAYSYLLAHTRPAVATSYAYVNPVIAVLLGVVFAGERFGVQSAVGATIILAAVALVQKRGAKSSVVPRPPAEGSSLLTSSVASSLPK